MSKLRFEYKEHVCHITLSHSPLNVIDIQMMDDLQAALTDVESRPGISTILFRGEGKAFSAGVDIPAHKPETLEQMLKQFHAAILALTRLRKITVAIVHGACLGGGAELAM